MNRLPFLPMLTGLLLANLLCPSNAQAQTQGKPPAETKITITAVGDINMGTDFPSTDYLPADGGAQLLAPVAHLLKGDVVFGNLEGPLADGGQTKKCKVSRSCYAFRTPTAYVRHLVTAGFNVLSIANNHAMDFGEEGRQSTIATLDQAGIAHSGPVGDIASLTAAGKKIALVAFHTADHSYYLLDVEKAVAVVAELDRSYDLVVVSFHGGNEGSRCTRVPDEMEHLGNEARGHLIHFAHSVVDAGADLVLGHGPHVLRGMEVYRKRLIAYSLGNFCTYGRFNLSGPLGIAGVLSVELSAQTGAFLGGKLHSTFQKKPGGAQPDPQARAMAMVQRLSQQDFPFSSPRFGKGESFVAPVGDGAGLFTLNTPADRKILSEWLAALAKKGFAKDKLRRWFGDARVELIPKVMERFRKPAEKMAYEKYRAIFVTTENISAGRQFLQDKAALLTKVEKKFGVDREALAGLVATETRFGKHRGDYITFNALATVVFRYPRRSPWAQREIEALLRQFPDRTLSVTGSYAGAVGLVQFMPTSIQAYGVDFDQDGKIDLSQWQDALGSAANYLKKHGWKKGQAIRRGQANYRALFRYNPAHHYVRVIKELAESFGLGKNG